MSVPSMMSLLPVFATHIAARDFVLENDLVYTRTTCAGLFRCDCGSEMTWCRRGPHEQCHDVPLFLGKQDQDHCDCGDDGA
ncbi:unnamed protein product [Absidia cylindrospora]